jgi:hypothetical protein
MPTAGRPRDGLFPFAHNRAAMHGMAFRDCTFRDGFDFCGWLLLLIQ